MVALIVASCAQQSQQVSSQETAARAKNSPVLAALEPLWDTAADVREKEVVAETSLERWASLADLVVIATAGPERIDPRYEDGYSGFVDLAVSRWLTPRKGPNVVLSQPTWKALLASADPAGRPSGVLPAIPGERSLFFLERNAHSLPSEPTYFVYGRLGLDENDCVTTFGFHADFSVAEALVQTLGQCGEKLFERVSRLRDAASTYIANQELTPLLQGMLVDAFVVGTVMAADGQTVQLDVESRLPARHEEKVDDLPFLPLPAEGFLVDSSAGGWWAFGTPSDDYVELKPGERVAIAIHLVDTSGRAAGLVGPGSVAWLDKEGAIRDGAEPGTNAGKLVREALAKAGSSRATVR